MTNGEKFKEVFKTSDVDEGLLYAFVWLSKHDEVAEINIDWWNEEYKEPTTKNDLGIDAVLRKKAITWAEYFSNIYDAKTANESIMGMLRNLPSVTPQEPKTGHWIEEFVDTEGEVRFTCSCCGKYQLFGTDFCYNCGAKMEEVEE